MSLTPPIPSALIAGILVIFQMDLILSVVLARRRQLQSIGDGGNPELLTAIRRHQHRICWIGPWCRINPNSLVKPRFVNTTDTIRKSVAVLRPLGQNEPATHFIGPADLSQ